MRKCFFLLWAVAAGLSFNSCKKDIEVPAYLHINVPAFAISGGQGTPRQNITYVGVYINDNLQGVFQTPVTIPTLNTGNVRLELRPLVKRLARDGQYSYNMMDGYRDSALKLTEGKTTVINPVFSYQDNTKFAWLDDFNSNTKSIRIDTTQSTIDSIYVTNAHGYGVDSSLYAYIHLTADDLFFRIETLDEFILPHDGRDVFLEFHYKSTLTFEMGLVEIASGNIVDMPSVAPNATSGEWKKGYIYLNDELKLAPADAKYKVFIRAVNTELTEGELFLDNFKLMYRE